MEMWQRIIEKREAAELSQSELARAMKLSPQSVQQWEKEGGTEPRGFRLAKLATILHTTPEYLKFGTDIDQATFALARWLQAIPIGKRMAIEELAREEKNVTQDTIGQEKNMAQRTTNGHTAPDVLKVKIKKQRPKRPKTRRQRGLSTRK